MKFKVIFASQTGNTELIAKTIYEAIPSSDKDILRVQEPDTRESADTYFIGFWTDRGTCSMDIMDYLGELHNKNIALFGTCGMGSDKEYYHRIENQVSAMIPDDNLYLGTFLCQGKMPIQARNKYEEMLKSNMNPDFARYMIHNFDQGLLHPDSEDFIKARKFVETILRKLPIENQ